MFGTPAGLVLSPQDPTLLGRAATDSRSGRATSSAVSRVDRGFLGAHEVVVTTRDGVYRIDMRNRSRTLVPGLSASTMTSSARDDSSVSPRARTGCTTREPAPPSWGRQATASGLQPLR